MTSPTCAGKIESDMFTHCCPIVLASGSPRRKHFLHQLGIQFRVEPAFVDETPESGESPDRFAERMARSKAEQVASLYPDACIIAADTVVALDRRIFGKPRDHTEAVHFLCMLQGRTHEVTSGLAVVYKKRTIKEITTETTSVTFDTFDHAVLQAYVQSGEPMDKAGAYGIQGKGTFLVRSLCGSYSNVVGLPMGTLLQILIRHQLIVADSKESDTQGKVYPEPAK